MCYNAPIPDGLEGGSLAGRPGPRRELPAVEEAALARFLLSWARLKLCSPYFFFFCICNYSLRTLFQELQISLTSFKIISSTVSKSLFLSYDPLRDRFPLPAGRFSTCLRLAEGPLALQSRCRVSPACTVMPCRVPSSQEIDTSEMPERIARMTPAAQPPATEK